MDAYYYGLAGAALGFVLGLAVMWLMRSPPKTLPPTMPEPPKLEKRSGAALRLLALLQSESRLVDFFLENIDTASNEQIGAAVRDIHKKAQATLKQHLILEPVLPGNEGDPATVPAGFDPSAIRVLGNVTGEPPYRGTVQHPGWRVKEIKLNPLPSGVDEFVLQAAEVQID